MADINFDTPDDETIRRAMSLLFFAYRDFVSDPDKVLAGTDEGGSGMGRAHHRVIHFVNNTPGITVAQLLEILQITKQSLSRVLRKLVNDGFIRQEIGTRDARQRLLYLTDKGERLEQALSSPQMERLRAAFAEAGTEPTQSFLQMLERIVNADDRAKVRQILARAL